MSNVNDGKNVKPRLKTLYNTCIEFFYEHHKEWSGSHEDFILQISCMDKSSYIKVHCGTLSVSLQVIPSGFPTTD